MLPFKKGAFHVAVNSNLPILPIGTNPSSILPDIYNVITVIARHHFLDSKEKVRGKPSLDGWIKLVIPRFLTVALVI